MARTFEEARVLALNLQRRRAYFIRYMQEIKRFYEADWVVPNPSVKEEPDVAQMIPSLITDTVDGLGMRAASVLPTVYCPAKKPHIDGSARKGTNRRRILNATYHQNRWKIKARRYYRHQVAYGTGVIFVEPDFKTGTIRMRVRDPLFSYPEPTAGENVEPPHYVANITRHSGAELRMKYPAVREENSGPIAAVNDDAEWDVMEWIDDDQIMFGLLGPLQNEGDHISTQFLERMGHGPWMQLGPSVVNRANRCLVVTPQEVSLHSIGTRLNALLGNVHMQSQLMSLEVLAQQKAIFPDMFVIGNPNETPKILSGAWQDGRTGAMNLLSGVGQVGQISQTPDVRNQAMIDRLERNTRVSAGLNPQMGGESYGSLRTGRALDAMMASSVDPRIQEMHEVHEAWMPYVNSTILAAYEGWFPDKKYTIFSGWPSDKGMIEFTPEKDIEGIYDNTVSYAVPGADVIQTTQVLGSLLGAKVISTDSFQSKHPWIDDSDQEQDNIVKEDIHKAMLAGVQEQIASGQMPMSIVAKLYDKIAEGMALSEAMTEIDEEIRAEQARAAEEAQLAQAGASAQMGLAAGPAAAAPGALPPEMMAGGGGPPLGPQGPEVDMAAMLQGALGGGA